MTSEHAPIYRILDANINRLREALRVIEEYFRFIIEDENACVTLKGMRHKLADVERDVGQKELLSNRDTATDCFASETRPEEMGRANTADVLTANLKRSQEACRVIEEYAKVINADTASSAAKEIRFSVYELEKSKSKSNSFGN